MITINKMKMKKSLLMLSMAGAILMGTQGCVKSNALSPACEINNTGTLKVVCNKSDPYKVYLNNAYKGTVGSYTSKDFGNISAGTYATRYEQASGYLLYPTEYTLSVTIPQCNTFTATLY
jgi:hypothetical protein